MNKTRKGFIYSVYIIAVTGVFIYLQFPSDAAKTYISAQANTVDPFLRITVDDVKPLLPLGLSIATAVVYWKRHLAFETDRIRVFPQYKSLMSSHIAFRLSGFVYGGELKSRLTIAENKQISLETDFTNIRLEQLPAMQSQLKPGISGTCSGTISYRSRSGIGGTTDARLTLSNGTLDLAALSVNIQSIKLSRVEAEVVLDKNRLLIKNCQVKSPQGNGRFEGMIHFGVSRQENRLDLTGTLKPNQAVLTFIKPMLPEGLFTQISSGKNGLSISIRGPLEDPTVVFNES